MLVQALAAYADRDLAEQLADRAFEEKPVPFWIELDEKGRFLGVVPKRSTNSRGDTLLIAKSPENRNSGVKPLLAADAIQYVVGPDDRAWSTPKDSEKHQGHHDGFIKLIDEAAQASGNPILEACRLFYSQPDEVAKAREDLVNQKASAGIIVALSVRPGLNSASSGGPVIKQTSARNFWITQYDHKFDQRHAKAGSGVCLISGKPGPLAITHEKIKGTSSLGGQPAGVSLMSFDKEAFESYGWEKNVNSPVHPERAMAYVLALNDLLKHGEHRQGRKKNTLVRTRVDLAAIGFLFWTREPFDDLFLQLERPDPSDLATLLNEFRTGQVTPELKSDDFYLLAVSGNGGRLVIRDWFWDKLERVLQNIADWQSQLQIANVFDAGELSTTPSIERLLLLLTPPGSKPNDSINAERSLRMIRRALMGTPLPASILAAALKRLHSERGNALLNPERNGLIRLCVNDLLKVRGKEERLMETIHEEDNHPAYVCGRLLAVYEELQFAAQGDLNVNVTDRFFTMASTMPRLAFTRMEDLSRAHLKKLRRLEETRGAYFALDSRINTLIERLHQNFPDHLNLEEQGRFVVGYHHQKAESARQRKEAAARKEAEREKKRQQEQSSSQD